MEFLRKPFTFFSHGSKKRGMSEIVATVLTIFIVIVGITVVWVVILPMIQNGTLFFQNGAEVSIVIDKGYTVFDISKQVASVQIKRGADEVELARLNIIFDVEGTSKTFETESAPNTNGAKTFWFNFSDHDDLMGETPTYVSVVPVYLRNGQEILGDVADRVEVPLGTILLEDEELAKIFSISGGVPYRKNDTIPVAPVTGSVIEIDSCRELNKSGFVYTLTESINGITGTCFNITADDVALDLGGYSINGAEDGYGIYVEDHDYANITNGGVYGFEVGIYLYLSSTNRLSNIIARDNDWGVALESSSLNILSHINASFNNFAGLTIQLDSNNNKISNIITNNNSDLRYIAYGIFVYDSSNNEFSNVNASFNGKGRYSIVGNGVGLKLGLNNTISDSIINSNSWYGVFIDNSFNSSIINSIMDSNGMWGINYHTNSNNSFLYNVTITNNFDGGILMISSGFNNLTKVYSCDNNNYDFKCSSSSGIIGSDNNFSNVLSCSDEFPLLDTNYVECP